MLSLDSPRWAELRHAYGSAADIPALLRQLESMPDAEGDAEPWFALWSALAHQDDVYSASFAAVPHVIAFLAAHPARATATWFQFPAWVEVCRQRQKLAVPEDLDTAYFAALARIPGLAAAAACQPWDTGLLCCVLSAIAAARGDVQIAEAVLEFADGSAASFMAWVAEQ